MQKIPIPSISKQISFPYSIKSKIEEIKSYFEPLKKKLFEKEIFYGTVDTLEGIADNDNGRSGLVTMTILYNYEIFSPKINLSSEQYKVAVEAHGKGKKYVRVVGDLKKENRKQSIENVTSFSLAD